MNKNLSVGQKVYRFRKIKASIKKLFGADFDIRSYGSINRIVIEKREMCHGWFMLTLNLFDCQYFDDSMFMRWAEEVDGKKSIRWCIGHSIMDNEFLPEEIKMWIIQNMDAIGS
jgi:hypothetical protein